MNQKNWVLLLVILAMVLIGAVVYFTIGKKSESLPANSQKSSQLLVPTVNRYTLTFDTNSACDIGLDKGSCIVLLSSFTGGENVTIDGLQGLLRKESDGSWSLISVTKIAGSSLVVEKLTLNDNLVTNGHLVQSISESGQKAWSLVYQPPIGDSAVQDPNRPTITIPLKFDEKSTCGDTGEKKCSAYELHQNDRVFIRGIKYSGALLVRLLTIPAMAPSTLPQ